MSLKDLRHDLSDHLATGLGTADAALGAQVNPPAVTVQPGDPYVSAASYCQDSILFAVTIAGPPGDPSAVADGLDDLIDLVRGTLKVKTDSGNLFGFREISGFTTYPSGDRDLPAVVVTVGIDRSI